MKHWQLVWGFGMYLTELGSFISEVGTDLERYAEGRRKQQVLAHG